MFIFLSPDNRNHLLLAREKTSWLKEPLIVQPLKRDGSTQQTLSSSSRSLYIGNPCLCSSIVKFVFFPYDALFPPNVARFHSGMSSFASPTPRISWAKIGLSPFTKQEGQNYDDYLSYKNTLKFRIRLSFEYLVVPMRSLLMSLNLLNDHLKFNTCSLQFFQKRP